MRTFLLITILVAAVDVRASETVSNLFLQLEANPTHCERGTPVILRLTLQNTGDQAMQLVGSAGWGAGLSLRGTREGGKFVGIHPEVQHADGTGGAIYFPAYWFRGNLSPEVPQTMLLLMRSDSLDNGEIALTPSYGQRGIAVSANESRITIAPKATSTPPDSLTENRAIVKAVIRVHNMFGNRHRLPGLEPLVRKHLDSNHIETWTEFALYAGVLQGIAINATDEDLALAKEAATAFLERFPESWLRAHTYAALILIARHEGNETEAQRLLEKGLQLPESNPLFYDVGILPQPGEEPSEQAKPEVPHEEGQ